MSLNIIDLIKGQLGPALVSQAATQFGESESGISKAISALLPAIVGGMANNAEKPGVLDAITGAASSGMLGNLLGGTANNSMISTILSSIFGDKIGGLLNAVSSFSGVSNSTSNSLLNMVTGATLGTVGKYAADNKLGASGISSLLENQKGLVSALLPAGLSLGSLGLGNMFGNVKETVNSTASSVTSTVSNTSSNVKETISTIGDNNNDNNGGGSIWKWLLPLLLLIGVSIFLWKKCEGNKDAVTTTTSNTDTTKLATDTTGTSGISADSTAVAPVKESTVVTLPSGKTINAFKGGVEDQLVTFLKSDEYKNATEEQLKAKWFNFDNLNFEFGTTKITKESQVQVDNLKAILAEFKDAKAKIGAYTDKVGGDAGNLALSQKRADAVKAAVASAQIIEAKGYGETQATVAETASDKEREADRKTAIRLTK